MTAPARTRYLGLAATVLLAVSAWLAGALPGGDPAPGLRTSGLGSAPVAVLAGLACWLAGAAALCLIWWRAAASRTDPPSERWVLVTGVLWAAPLLLSPPLASRDVYAYACQGWVWLHGFDPYALGVAQAGCPWTASVPELWWSTPTPYGPLALALAGLAAWLGGPAGGLLGTIAALRVAALAGAALLAVFLPRLARSCGLAPSRALWLGLVTPLAAVHAIAGAHNDIVVAGLVVAALALAAGPGSSAGRGLTAVALLAGAAVGAAVAIKVTAVVALPFVLLLAGRRRWAALGGAVGLFAGLSLVTGLGLGWIAALSGTGELVQWSSAPTALGMTAGYLLRGLGRPEWTDEAVLAARALGLLALAAAGLLALRAAWRARTREGGHGPGGARTVVLACGTALAATALLGPVFYPWYALTPLAVLAACVVTASHRRALMAGTVVCALLALPNGLGVPVLTKAVGAVAVTAAVIVAGVRAARRAGSTATS